MKFILLAAAALLVVGLSAVFFSAPTEPYHQGKPLSDWTSFVESDVMGKPIRLKDESADAVRAMGEDSIPLLLVWITAPTSGLKAMVLEKLRNNEVPTRFMNQAVMYVTKTYRPREAVLAFKALGDKGAPAIPALVNRVHEPENSSSAISALCGIGQLGILALAKEYPTILDKNERGSLIHQLGVEKTPENEFVISGFLADVLKTEPAGAIRMSCAHVFAKMTNNVEFAVEKLTVALDDTDGGVVMTALDGLKNFGSDASYSTNAIQRLIKSSDSSPSIRAQAKLTFQTIVSSSANGRTSAKE